MAALDKALSLRTFFYKPLNSHHMAQKNAIWLSLAAAWHRTREWLREAL